MTSFVVLTSVKATLVCGLALLISRVCRHTRASVRHLLFALSFAALAAIPAASLVLPTMAVTVPAITTTASPHSEETSTTTLPSSAIGDSLRSHVPVVSRYPPVSTVTMNQLLTVIWLTGVLLFLIPVIVGFAQVRRLRKRAPLWSDGQALLQRLGPTRYVRRIEVLRHEAVTGPMMCGVLRPVIVMPVVAERWTETSLRCSLKHELEHVARWDFLTLALSRMICAAYWFHPMVWAAWRQMRLEAERACDDAVLREHDARDYASLLLSMAQRQPLDAQQPLLAMAGRDDLATRVSAVLNDDHDRGHVGRRLATALFVATAIAVCGIAPITAVRAMPQSPATIATGIRLRFETVSLTRHRGNDKSIMYFTQNVDGDAGVGPDGKYQWLKATNIPTRILLSLAYTLELTLDEGMGGPHQVDHAPEWIDSDRFDVVAKASSRATKEQMHQMMQSLLADRFKLKAHLAVKDFPLYALAKSRSDGNLGPRMSPSRTDCTPKPNTSSPCGLSSGTGRLTGRGVTMSQLVKVLPNHLGGAHHIGLDRPLIDKTDVSGAFDFTLEWTPDAREVRSPTEPRLFQFRPFEFPVESKAQNFLAALQAQLGLMLENQWAPQPVLVIDRIEPPAEN